MNEKRLESLGLILSWIQYLLGIYAVVIAVLWFIKGGNWFRESILPIHGLVFFILLIITFLILIPLLVIKGSRPYSILLLYQLTLVFGGIAWFYSAHYCLNFLSTFWFILGVLIAGVGIAPVAIIGSMIKGHWEFFWFIGIQIIATFGCRFLAIYATSTSE